MAPTDVSPQEVMEEVEKLDRMNLEEKKKVEAYLSMVKYGPLNLDLIND